MKTPPISNSLNILIFHELFTFDKKNIHRKRAKSTQLQICPLLYLDVLHTKP